MMQPFTQPDFPNYSIAPPDEALTITVRPGSYDYSPFILLGLIMFATYRLAVN